MGFDNECILNIQSLAGEYFCPVCRLLVYPNEALQSLCTHLYCKPCLTYVASTTRACPYDGYLVTEADSKPLIESNKSLAETIGKIAVHCLYHRSGCTWQGSLSDCTSHCSGCAFGNSPVVCNRCAIQIVHRQVQEHAQSCPGVQPQAQAEGAAATSATGSAATADQTLSATQTAALTSQVQPAQSVVTAPGKDPNQQSISSSQAQGVVQGTVSTAEQWYQQQQQYQQYYQQYPGYGQYQQQYLQYHAYQQQHVPAHASNAAGQHQPQVYTQPQPQLQPPSQPQPQPQASLVQAPVATQPQSQAQINLQQQVHPVIPQHSQIQPQTYPLVHGHSQPQPQPYTQSQLQQPHPQPVQHQQAHPQPHIQQQIQTQVQPHHPPSQPQLLSQAQQPAQLQPRPQPTKPPNANIQSQTQNPTSHAMMGHHSYPQPYTEPPMQTGVPQQYPIQMQSQLPQQPLLMRPPQPHATIPSQQQLALLPPRGQVPNVPPAQQSVQQPHFQQAGQPVHQRPVMQPVQQTFPQQQFQQQQPMPLQLRPQGQSNLIPPQTHSYPQPSQSVASPHGTQHATSPNPVGRPSMPSQGLQSQPYPPYTAGLIRPTHPGINQQSLNQNNMLKTSNQMQLPSEYSGANSKLIVPAKTGATDDTGAGVEIEKSNIDVVKPADYENKVTEEVKADRASTTSKESKYSSGMQGEENGEPMVKSIMTEGDLGSTLKHSGEVITEDKKDVLKEGPEKIKHSVEDKKTVDGYQHKNPPLQALEHHEVQVGNFVKDAISGSVKGSQGVSTPSAQIHGNPAQSIVARGTASGVEVKSSYQHGVQDTSHPQVAGVQEYGGFPRIGQVQAGGFIEPPHPMPEQGKHQPLPSHYGPPTFPQRPGGSPLGPPRQTPGLGPPQTHFGPQVPGHPLHPPGSIPDPSATSFGRGPSQYGPAQQSSELQPVAPRGPYNPVHSGALPPAFESHGGMIARETPYGPDMFPNQRPNYMDTRRLDPHFPGSLEHGPLPEPFGIHPNMKRMNGGLGLDSASTLGPRDDRLPLQAERFNSFPAGPDHRVSNRAEFEDDLKKFPRPFDRGSHGLRYDTGLKMESGAIPARFLSPYDGGLSNYVGDRLGGRHEDTFGRMEPTHGRLEFFGPDPSFGRHYMDEFGSRSPGREHPGIYSRGFGGPGSDDIHGRELHRFGESFGGPFPESRFSLLPSHLRRGEFEGPGNMGMGDHLRNDFIGKDGFSSHLRRGDHMGNLYGHLHLREPVGFGAHPRHAWMREIGGPGSLDSFGGGDRPSYPHLGEPGFRSSYSLRGFPNDGGIFSEELAFDKSKKRKQPSMGWCRICKVDCETVEALELHSQTREHQKMAMDIVITIKQNAKKKKLTSGDQSSLGDASKSRNGGSEDRGNKN